MRSQVSVVIPAFQNQELLSQSLDTWLKQTIQPDEIIVVDDGSDPPLETPAEVARIRINRAPVHRGSSAAKNAGAKVAASTYLCFADAEVLVMPETLESMLAAAHEWETEGHADFLLNVNRCSLPVRVFASETSDMLKFYRYARYVGWIDGRYENHEDNRLCYEQNCSIMPREFFWRLGGYDEVGFPSWGFNNQDLDLRVVKTGGILSSSILRMGTKYRLICFHNFHEHGSSKQQAEKEFIQKHGVPFHGSMIGEIQDRNEDRFDLEAARKAMQELGSVSLETLNAELEAN